MSKKNKQQSTKQIAQPLVISDPTYIAYFDGAYGPTERGVMAACGAIIIQEG